MIESETNQLNFVIKLTETLKNNNNLKNDMFVMTENISESSIKNELNLNEKGNCINNFDNDTSNIVETSEILKRNHNQ